MHPPIRKQIFGLLGWLFLVFCAALIGAIASISAASFYEQLNRPEWSPPASVFGPVWNILYFLMAISAWLVWRDLRNTRIALTLFIIQLSVNALWSWLFFACHSGLFAFLDIILLLALIAATIIKFWKINRFAAALMIPYLAWVSFASALTWELWQSNPGVL